MARSRGGAPCRCQPPLPLWSGEGGGGRSPFPSAATSAGGQTPIWRGSRLCFSNPTRGEGGGAPPCGGHPAGAGRWRCGEEKGESSSEQPSLCAFAANRFWGRRRSRGRNMPCVFRARPAREKEGQLSDARAVPFLPAKGTLNPGKGGAQCPCCLSKKGETSSSSSHRRPLPPLSPTARGREERTGKARTKKRSCSVVFVKNNLKKRRLRKQLEM